ncbi:centriolar coiled-coil protein of 110 kDa isoform X2 [Rhea pennata]|uniref:centriolar coiled-coil protein of 110 kDa isoform X2 n=1 Tax=Rhea pennata TaxID=8795 RepID=UPI002E25B6C6
MKMEDYDKFCKKHFSRIQEEAIKTETSFSAPLKNMSLIQFHGVPVLSPLLSFEKKKEIQQDKQKALNLENWKQNSKKRALLNRVQEILENVQIRKASSASDLNMWEAENTCPDSESKALTDVTPLSDVNLLHSPGSHGSTELEKTPEIMPSNATRQVTSSVSEIVKGIEENVKSESYFSKNIPCPKALSSDNVNDKLASQTAQSSERPGVPLSDEEVQDPYAMSLQNLLKKSREYIEKEQTKRSSRSNSKRCMNESHSDKENDAVKTTDSVKERAKLTGRSCAAATLDKPSLNKSNTILQGASTHTNSTNMPTLSSFSKVDIPMRVGTPPLVSSDSDEEFKNTSTFDRDSSIIRSLTGSYAKLPSPEPSMSPKMHRRRPRPLSMGHIVINNPVNAYELSPKGKGRAMDLIMQDIADKNNVSESVPKFMVDFAMICPGKVPGVHRNSSDLCDGLVIGKSGRHSLGHLESKGAATVSATVEGQVVLDGRGQYKVETSTNIVAPKLHEPFAVSQSMITQKILAVNEAKPPSLLEHTKCNSPVELNKSYDVENPSPLLMQNKNKQQQMDTPNVSLANEQFLENGFEKVKRRLDLDTDSSQKENSPYVLAVGMEEQEKQWLQEQKYPVGSVYVTKNAIPDSTAKEILKTKMLAFEEMRKRLEEQHAQQLSILIAEQEREQEKLQKELEEQERKLKGKKTATTEIEISKVNINSRMELEWRKSESGLLESMQSQMETVHNANSASIGFAHTTPNTFASTSETSFFLWGPSGSGVIKTSVSRPSNRIKTRWTQVFSPDIQIKFSKITAVAKGFLTRRLMQTEKLKYLKQTVKDTMEFIKDFQLEAPLKRGSVSAQDASLHERVMAQLRAALYDIHDIFFIMEASERMNILRHDREVRKEKMLRQMDKVKSPRERATLSTATQKSLDRKKCMKASEMGMPSKKIIIKQKTPESRVLQPNQGQNAPVHRLLCRQGTPKTSMKGVEQNRKKASESRVSNKAVSGAYAGRTQRKKPNVVTI